MPLDRWLLPRVGDFAAKWTAERQRHTTSDHSLISAGKYRWIIYRIQWATRRTDYARIVWVCPSGGVRTQLSSRARPAPIKSPVSVSVSGCRPKLPIIRFNYSTSRNYGHWPRLRSQISPRVWPSINHSFLTRIIA